MAYWLTVHWPSSRHAQGYPAVWARARNNVLADGIAEGDMVAIYETRNNEGGAGGCEPGAKAVIRYGKVICCYPAQQEHGFALRAKLNEGIECEGARYQRITQDILPGFSPNIHGLMQVTREAFLLMTHPPEEPE